MRRALIVLVCWTLFGLLWSGSASMGRDGGTAPVAALDHVLPFYWAWALLTLPLLGWFGHAIGDHGRGVRVHARLLLPLPLVLVAHAVAYQLLLSILGVHGDWSGLAGRAASSLTRHAGGDAATYLTLVAGTLLVAAERRAREREMAAAMLEARLALADVELLRWRLHPHFLFNALNSVTTLALRDEPRQVVRAIELIARYLRTALAQRPESAVSLDDELRDVRRYVEIETIRFGESLRLETRIAEGLGAVMVPGAILQPLIENAVRHGAGRDAGTPIVVSASRQGARVILAVEDGGDGSDDRDDRSGTGFGLRYVRERLRHFYGESARVDLRRDRGATVATIDLPASLVA